MALNLNERFIPVINIEGRGHESMQCARWIDRRGTPDRITNTPRNYVN